LKKLLSSWLPESLRRTLLQLVVDKPIWLVGGSVRDWLLGRAGYDLDFVVEDSARNLARRVADQLDGYYYDLDTDRDAGRVIVPNLEGKRCILDFAKMRGLDLTADLQSRDFTINAMAIGLQKPDHILDPLGGAADLKGRWLRSCSPSAISNDPIRALRAVRLANELEFKLTAETITQIREIGDGLAIISPERIRDEFFHILNLPRPGNALRELNQMGLYKSICPELESVQKIECPYHAANDALEHSLRIVDRLADVIIAVGEGYESKTADELGLDEIYLLLGRYQAQLNTHLSTSLSDNRNIRQLLFFAALYYKAGEPDVDSEIDSGSARFWAHDRVRGNMAAERALDLRLSNREVRFISKVVAHPIRITRSSLDGQIPRRSIYRFFRDTGKAGVDVVLLSLADFLAQDPLPIDRGSWSAQIKVANTLLNAYYEQKPQIIDPPLLVRGDELALELGLSPGPKIGCLLELIREGQAVGDIRSRQEAVELAKRALNKSNLMDEC
jgi:tRNA nucleotidyltransferase/poly(A) polymerase